MKHVLSKESQELFNKLSSALLDETNTEWQQAALASIRTDPGIHQLSTYLMSFIAEKVTHNLKNLFLCKQMMLTEAALLDNRAIYLDPYVGYLVPPALTVCIAKHIGPPPHQAPSNASSETLNGNGINGNSYNPSTSFEVRDLAASILGKLCSQYGASNQGLKTRVGRSCLKAFLDPHKGLGAHYGALTVLLSIAGPQGMMVAILPNLRLYGDEVLKDALGDESKKPELDRVVALLLKGLDGLERTRGTARANGVGNLQALKDRLAEKVGEVLADRIVASGRSAVAQILLESNVSL